MPEAGMVQGFLAGACVDAEVFALLPDYRVLLLAVAGIAPGPGDPVSDALVQAAEAAAREALRGGPAEELPHVAAWREAYRAFGAKPRRTRTAWRRCCAGRRPGRPPPDRRRPDA
jgi:DNA/RNA-binding domain of Phe-tRNA-synthetase-like protein